MYRRLLAELQRWAESFGAGFKASGPASPAKCIPVGTLQDRTPLKASFREQQGLTQSDCHINRYAKTWLI